MAEAVSESEDQEVAEEREQLIDAERLVVFTDAVVAIAMTLLVLPLLEAVPKHGSGTTTADWLGNHVAQLLALVVSFVVVASFWHVHNRIWSFVSRQTAPLLVLNILWMLDIVFLQIPTALVYDIKEDRALVALYIGTMAVGALILNLMAWVIWRTPSVQDPAHRLPRERLVGGVAATVVYVVALVLGVAIPGVGYYGLFALVLIGPARAVATRLAGP